MLTPVPGPSDELQVESAKDHVERGRRPIAAVVAQLTGANLLVLVMAFVTGPIQARSLGPAGRGELAAILQPLQVIIWLLDFGLTGFVIRERARGTDAGSVYGTVAVLSVVFSLLGVGAAIPLAHALGQGRRDVVFFLTLGLFAAPLSVALLSLSGAVTGEERWRSASLMTVIPPLLTLVALCVLVLVGRLTVLTAAAASLGAGLVGNLPVIVVVARARRWRWQSSLARRALRFGLQNWLANVAILGNARLDQLVMAGLASSRQLGLYAVAASISGVTSVFVSAISAVLYPRMAASDPQVVRKACRFVLMLVTLASIGMAVMVPFLVPLIFGSSFTAAVPMVLILLLNPLPGALMLVLSASLTGSGRPGATLRPQAIGLAVGVPLLVLVLPRAGGLGASVVTVVSSLVAAGLLLRAALGAFGGRARDYIVPRREDVGTMGSYIRALVT
jgi:O-antigen/teichoic acid export membrane protein